MSRSRETPMRPVEVTSSSSIVGQLLGDTLMGACWRAVEQAEQPDVEVRVYVRSLAEAETALLTIMATAHKRGILKHGVSIEEARTEATKLGGVVAVNMTNGSVIVFKKETRSNR
jgi:hypothetical protein